MVGKTIAHYEITAKLGEGGMGVVYRARDTKLGRDVALKALSEEFASDRQRMARFDREARLLASLNHPNIASIYGLEESGNVHVLVMELVEGPALENRIAQGPVPVDEALPLARQMAEALEYAHHHGIVHRDLKPANVKVTEEGALKVLDFGLAKAMEDPAAAVDPESTPTVTLGATEAGMILGTAAYMSPEQARGKPVDQRADIWAFGVVLYEMLTGSELFRGESISDTLADVLRSEIDLTALPAGTPPAIRRLLRRCLERDRKHRLQSIGDARIEIEEALAPGPEDLPEQIRPQPQSLLPWVLVALIALFAAVVSYVHFREAPPEVELRRFAVTPPVAVNLPGSGLETFVAVSPNGRHIAFVGAEGGLWVQDLDHELPREIAGTEGASWPFWSPESEFIGFVAGDELQRIPVRGGLVNRICELPSGGFDGATWSWDGEVIVFSAGALYEVPARGGTPRIVPSSEDPTGTTYTPHFLPEEAGHRVVVYRVGSQTDPTLVVQDLESGRQVRVGPGTSPNYSPSGHLLYQPDGASYDLWAVPFSLDTLQAAGDAFPVAQNSRSPRVADDGTLVYLDAYYSGQQQLVWLNRTGNRISEVGVVEADIGDPSLSPDGKRVAYWAPDGPNWDVWAYDIDRGVRTRLSTTPQREYRPSWSPDSEQVAFTSMRSGNRDIFLRHADGTGEEALAVSPRSESMSDWSRDGQYILYSMPARETGSDLWYLERAEAGAWEPNPFLEAPASQTGPKFSPNGRYVAYLSDESGRYEVYVRSFPDGDRQWTVSSNGGMRVRWNPNGEELFYVEGGDTLMAVALSTEGEFSARGATRLFDHPGLRPGGENARYDVSPDGERFLLVEPVGGEAAQPLIRVVQNWFAEFRGRQAGQ